MDKHLISVGIDVGTTSTQLVVSRLRTENRSAAFCVPEMVISSREVLYRSPVHFTPLLGKDLVDGEKIRQIVAAEYENAGLSRENVDTGAIIITGETSRKENAEAVLRALSGFAGDFVVATAGPELESVLAAKGAGAVEYSAQTGKTVLHMDIGGGTSNLALIREGRIEKTGCLNVGGRLVKVDKSGMIDYVSPALQGLFSQKVGQQADLQALEKLAEDLAQALEMAAGLRERTQLLELLWTREAGASWVCSGECTLSFSGGVADCMEKEHPWLEFGDLGPILGRKILKSRLCGGPYRLGSETIRATVIGAGSHSLQLTGSTVFHRGMEFPMQNLPVVFGEEKAQMDGAVLGQLLEKGDTEGILAIPGLPSPDYGKIAMLAQAIAEGFGDRRILVAVEQDMAKALGQRIGLLRPGLPVLCIDGVKLRQGDYLDIGAPVGTALPVVVKTLILER